MEVFGQVFRRVEPVLGICVCHTTRQYQTSILVMACSYSVTKLYKLGLLEYVRDEAADSVKSFSSSMYDIARDRGSQFR